MTIKCLRLISALLIVAPSSVLAASDFYFSALGNDLSGNGSAANPWLTVAKFNTLDLDPGDRVLFRAGDVFDGSLSLVANDTGTNALGQLVAPIVIGSYGSGPGSRATIRSPTNQPALLARNNGGIELRDLEFVNGGTYGSNSGSGIRFEITQSASGGLTQFEHIRLSNVAAHGFHQSGLSLYAANNVGYDDVIVSDSEFYANQYSGIEISAALWADLIHRSVVVDRVVAHDNPGFIGCSPHCGHGVVLGQVDGATIGNSTAHSNGTTAGKGNVGLWTWQSNNVVIERNQAYGNRSPLGGDGGGFDLDGGVTNSVVQYNVSQDNDGAGYLLAQFAYAEPMSHNTFRYNLSVNDGRDGYGAITVWGATPDYTAESAVFHNNTVVVDRNAVPNSRGPVWFLDSHQTEIAFVNNIFVALNGAKLIEGIPSPANAQFSNNDYWTDGQAIKIGGVTYASIAAWAAASQQELWNGVFVGVEADPQFSSDGIYRPLPPSQLIDAGLPQSSAAWPAWFAGLGPTDLFAVPLPQGTGVDIGAAEFAMPGDYNFDGQVDAADYVVWRKNNGIAEQYNLWRVNFGNLTGAGSNLGRIVSVPDPSAAILVLGIAIGAGWFRPLFRSLH